MEYVTLQWNNDNELCAVWGPYTIEDAIKKQNEINEDVDFYGQVRKLGEIA